MLPEPPGVSIVMPAYNAQRFIGAAIESVLAQTHTHWQLIVVDDASDDGTAGLLRAFQQRDPRVHYERMSSNQGVVAARNRALELAQGRYVAFLDSDDLWEPTKLARQVAFMEQSGTLVSYADYLRVDEAGHILSRVRSPARVGYADMLKSNQIGNLTGIFLRSALADLRFESVRHEDYLFWLRALARVGQARATPSDEPLAHYRTSAGSLSANKLRAAGWQWRIYREALGLSYTRSAYLFTCYALAAVRKRRSLRGMFQ
ncbi:glycosyltransferase family 2 protein [Bordetella sp. BOR01]|uniref:glycosyltransferase family 2 protein n=1 Tax=Bordetella sp. BOR01 TaxID=2854779 RepID=UPI001C484A98|nr:glycosyltransferase family 2 protein [Bordetella sp. BOR01]MBV7485438.1 glycosyltransferase family 2 protein [Bordetella sp. BOR01]